MSQAQQSTNSAISNATSSSVIKDFHVCTECGKRQSRLIKKLQESNYRLERCDRCNQISDRYLEYEDNLKFLAILLCQYQIYRHIYFNINYDKIRLNKRETQIKCLVFSFIYLALINWNENCLVLSEQPIPNVSPQEIEPQFRHMHEFQAQNLHLLTSVSPFDHQMTKLLNSIILSPIVLKRILSKHIIYMLVIFICTYIFKRIQTQHGRHTQSNVNPKVGLGLRLWLVLTLSQIGYLGIIVQTIWNYNHKFFQILNVYSVYSTYVCLTAIINSKFEAYISIFIIAFALSIQQVTQLF